MTTALTASQSPNLAHLQPLLDAAQTYANNAQASTTKRAYASDWADFDRWCGTHGVASLPAQPATVALYLVDRINTLAVSTLLRRLAAIAHQHRLAHYDTPTASQEVRTILQGIKRVHGTAQEGKAAAVTADLKAMVATLPASLLGTRDRALLLIGFAAALRRGELVALDVADLQLKRDGVVLRIRRSKTDQDGQGAQIGIPYGVDKASCPVRALKAWLHAAALQDGPVFRPITRHGAIGPERLSDKAVALIVKRAAAAAGLDAAHYSGHSLRVGLVTQAVRAGVQDRDIMRQTRHRDVRMIKKYTREANVLDDRNVARHIGL